MTRPDDSTELAPSQRRLQRPADFTGAPLSTFAQVAWRHGLPGAALGVLCLLAPGMVALLGEGLAGAAEAPATVARRVVVAAAALVAYTAWLDRRLDAASVGWVFYLLAVSVWEEWVFRLALPAIATGLGLATTSAVVVSNAIFGGLHYVTLRWKWHWCVIAGLGGMGLARQLEQHGDLTIVILVHWVATVLNTPRLPGRSRRGARDAAAP